MPNITALSPLAPLSRLLLPVGLFGLQAHICSSLQVPFCTYSCWHWKPVQSLWTRVKEVGREVLIGSIGPGLT